MLPFLILNLLLAFVNSIGWNWPPTITTPNSVDKQQNLGPSSQTQTISQLDSFLMRLLHTLDFLPSGHLQQRLQHILHPLVVIAVHFPLCLEIQHLTLASV